MEKVNSRMAFFCCSHFRLRPIGTANGCVCTVHAVCRLYFISRWNSKRNAQNTNTYLNWHKYQTKLLHFFFNLITRCERFFALCSLSLSPTLRWFYYNDAFSPLYSILLPLVRAENGNRIMRFVESPEHFALCWSVGQFVCCLFALEEQPFFMVQCR